MNKVSIYDVNGDPWDAVLVDGIPELDFKSLVPFFFSS